MPRKSSPYANLPRKKKNVGKAKRKFGPGEYKRWQEEEKQRRKEERLRQRGIHNPKKKRERGPHDYLDSLVCRKGYRSYTDYLNSPHWAAFQKRCREVWPDWRCFACGHPIKVQLHHISYKRLGREEPSDVVPLCRYCHVEIHKVHKAKKIPLKDFNAAIREIPPRRP